MLDTRTIQALQALPLSDEMLALNAELTDVPPIDRSLDRGKAYVEKLLLNLEGRRRGQAELVKSCDAKILDLGKAVAGIKAEDTDEIRAALDMAVVDGDAKLQEAFKINRFAMKHMKINKKRATASYPSRKEEIIMIFDEVAMLASELLDKLADYNAAIRSFAAIFDPDAGQGEVFSDTESLEKYLKYI